MKIHSFDYVYIYIEIKIYKSLLSIFSCNIINNQGFFLNQFCDIKKLGEFFAKKEKLTELKLGFFFLKNQIFPNCFVEKMTKYVKKINIS
jgi:hypothetical protein